MFLTYPPYPVNISQIQAHLTTSTAFIRVHATILSDLELCKSFLFQQ